MSDFLLELRSEEIPARMQAGARAELERLFRKEMDAGGITLGDLTIWSTPRRLTLIAHKLPATTEAVSEEVKGPRTSAPPQALDGFLRKTGLRQDQLIDRDGVWFAHIERPGRAMADVLADAIPAMIRAFNWPKSMRWGSASASSESLRWVRPLSSIVALLDDALVACEVDGLAAGRLTRGHRFHHHGDLIISDVGSYADTLRAAHVIVDHQKRQAIIRDGAAKAASDAGLTLIPDEGLVVENAGLTEWPVPLLGRFDERFLEVPPEVIQLTARVNQKYFVCQDANGKLADAFVCTANIVPSDGGAGVVEGNRKVLAARLSDARFFWDQDQKKSLAQHAAKLANIVFHEKLGTVADKVDRVAKLARWLCEEGIVGGDPALAEQAARLCKADLVTEMVGEFPELQGLMGGYYAAAEGLPPEVAAAIRDHYKPVGQGDDVPTAPVTVAVSLADKLDTVLAFFAINEAPTGSKDPFALRRAALSAMNLLFTNGVRLSLSEVINCLIANRGPLHWSLLAQVLRENPNQGRWVDSESHTEVADGLERTQTGFLGFFADRLKVQQREAGVRHDLIDAVFALGGEDDLVRLLARVKALQAFMDGADGADLLAGYKRAANLLKQADPNRAPANAGVQGDLEPTSVDEGPGLRLSPENSTEFDSALQSALNLAEPAAAAAVAEERFTDAMAALASLRAPIDAFFDGVMVNDPDPDLRAFRLGLLARFTAAVHAVADFSKIEG